MLATAIALVLSAGTSTTPAPETISGPIKMKASEIRAYNANLTRDHPNYIRCVKVAEVGSLVRKTTTCRTNQEWARINDIGNDSARETLDGMNKSSSSTSN